MIKQLHTIKYTNALHFHELLNESQYAVETTGASQEMLLLLLNLLLMLGS